MSLRIESGSTPKLSLQRERGAINKFLRSPAHIESIGWPTGERASGFRFLCSAALRRQPLARPTPLSEAMKCAAKVADPLESF